MLPGSAIPEAVLENVPLRSEFMQAALSAVYHPLVSDTCNDSVAGQERAERQPKREIRTAR